MSDLPQSGRGEIEISFRRLLRLLPEGVQYVDDILYSGDIQHTECSSFVPDTDFPYPEPIAAIVFQSLGSNPSWTFVQLHPGLLPGRFWKASQLVKRVAEEDEFLHPSRNLYQNLYKSASFLRILDVSETGLRTAGRPGAPVVGRCQPTKARSTT